MPSLSTRLAYQAMTLDQAEAATISAIAAAAAANEAVEAIEGGTLDLDAVTVGGQRFINSGGNLIPEP